MQEKWVRPLGWEDPLDKGMATHSSILAWEIPWTEGYSPWGHKRVRHDLVTRQQLKTPGSHRRTLNEEDRLKILFI